MEALNFFFALEWEQGTSLPTMCHICRGLTRAVTSGSPGCIFPEGHLIFLPKGPGDCCPFCQAGIIALCNSIREGPLSSSLETQVKRGQGHTEACTNGYFTQGLSTWWRLPHKVKSLQGVLEPLGLYPEAFSQVSSALLSQPQFRLCCSYRQGVGWRVGQRWTWFTRPLPFASWLISSKLLLEPLFSHLPNRMNSKTSSVHWCEV